MLHSSRLLLRAVELDDLNPTYLGWINDSIVNRYLETRFLPHTLEALKSYWQKYHEDPSSPWFAICLKQDNRHIGNIKLGPIHWLHSRADISLFIGDSRCWGKGYASEAIALVRDWAFLNLDLYKLNAGIYAENHGSKFAFQKCGFEIEGRLIDECVLGGGRSDIIKLGLTRRNWAMINDIKD